MFVATKPLTESNRLGPPFEHQPGDVLERWAEWPYRVRVALLHAEMVEERPDPTEELVAMAEAFADEMEAAIAFVCPSCPDRTFESQSALKRHTTRKHR